MRNFFRRIRSSWFNSLVFSCFLLAIFFILFYLSNLDLKPGNRNNSALLSVPQENSDAELQKRLGGTSIAFLSYDGWAKQNNLGSGAAKYDGDPDKDGLPNYLEYIYRTDPNKADTDGDGFSDLHEIAGGYDPSIAGDAMTKAEISIDKIKVTAPIVWSKSEDENSLLEDLKSGVSLFPKTGAPGQNGDVVISGHSSNYIWVKGDYNYIFKDLNNLEEGDSIVVRTLQGNGAVIDYRYKVTGKFITVPDDERIFAETPNPTLTLSTCWPLGTNFRRLIIKAAIAS